ncbi:MAG: HAD family hydrolase [Actinomycetota bacterium]|jgi:HAD superfamily hydrolase (TIGR01549 family)|nr:HAD family hydrolase [Actinomycetota bacterium]PLS75579.1 MAG: HAD family hydrolase [Actinomycetota bacterium]
MPDARPAVLFDIDGTLVDTNYLHTVAWWRALRDAGEDVSMSEIHPLIGMGSDKLLEHLIGEERDGLRDAHAEQFSRLKAEVRAFPGARELLTRVAGRGAQVVLATSSQEADLAELLAAIDADDAITEIVHGDEVEASKPAPDIFATALDKLGLVSASTMVVGDTRWDVEAASKLGIDTVAVLTGGSTRRDLEEAGAAAVYLNVADLLDHLDDSPLSRLLGG